MCHAHLQVASKDMNFNWYLILRFLYESVEINPSSLGIDIQSVHIYTVHVVLERHTGSPHILNHWCLNAERDWNEIEQTKHPWCDTTYYVLEFCMLSH